MLSRKAYVSGGPHCSPVRPFDGPGTAGMCAFQAVKVAALRCSLIGFASSEQPASHLRKVTDMRFQSLHMETASREEGSPMQKTWTESVSEVINVTKVLVVTDSSSTDPIGTMEPCN